MVPSGATGQVLGASAISGIATNAQIPTTSVLPNIDDSSSSRSNSPLGRIPSPPPSATSFQYASFSASNVRYYRSGFQIVKSIISFRDSNY